MSYILPADLGGFDTSHEREAIIDALYRGVLGVDHADEALLRSAVTDDIVAEMPNATEPTQGYAAFKTTVFDRISKLDTTHCLSNVRVAPHSSGKSASVTASVLAQHVRPGEGLLPESKKFTCGSLYACELVKVGDLWKINRWKVKFVWVDGDPDVMTGL